MCSPCSAGAGIFLVFQSSFCLKVCLKGFFLNYTLSAAAAWLFLQLCLLAMTSSYVLHCCFFHVLSLTPVFSLLSFYVISAYFTFVSPLMFLSLWLLASPPPTLCNLSRFIHFFLHPTSPSCTFFSTLLIS